MKRRDFLKLGLAGVGTMALADNAWALKYYPKASDKKCAVLYGTWCGSSRDAAVWISEGMGGIADVFDVKENPDLKGFDHIVIGGSIRWGKTPQELQDYIAKNQSQLKGKVRGLFAVCGNMGKPITSQQKAMFIDNHLAQIAGVSDVPSKVFLGRMTADLLEAEVRKQMENMGPMEDSDNLKRAECLAFGKEVLAITK